uniref:Uncharacterized protein n=1 Tax=Pseudictyota dubia TaxID=2749911 RepID=A0A7R9ZIS5_9STRA|mmetsp:Transcript_688/g.980  ORF Transcript_688/g.980 Transcript_688/m.980 type:complete len:194 (+) Transcript_688:169-750(+)
MGTCLSIVAGTPVAETVSKSIAAVKDGAPTTADVSPSAERIEEIVREKIPFIAKEYALNFLPKYKAGVEESAPEPYVCEEVLTKAGKLKLTKGVDDELAVKKAALAASANESVREEIREEVWEEVEPDVQEKADKISMKEAREAALAVAREASDACVDKAIDEIIDEMGKKLERGEEIYVEEESPEDDPEVTK